MTDDDSDVHARLQSLGPATSAAHDAAIRERARLAFGPNQPAAARWPLALAATVLLAVPAAWIGLNAITTAPSNDVVRSATVGITPAMGAVLGAPPEELRWSAVPGARDYRVVLMDHEARTLWTSDPTSSARVRLPADLTESLRGQTLIWRVELTGPAQPAPLGPFDFTVR